MSKYLENEDVKKLFEVIIKYVAPVCIFLILVSSILEALGYLKI